MAHAQVGAGSPSIAPVNASFTSGMRPARAGQPAMLAQRQVIATRAPVLPAAYHDTLAQHFANRGGRVAGAGEPVVRTAAAPMFTASGRRPSPAIPAVQQGFHVINGTLARSIDSPTRQPTDASYIRPDENSFITAHTPATQQQRYASQAGNQEPSYRNPNTTYINNGPYRPAEQQHHFAPPMTNHEPYRNLGAQNMNDGPYVPVEQQHYFSPPANNRTPYHNPATARINPGGPESERQPAHAAAHVQRQAQPTKNHS